jgi:hypothetical protein
MGFKHAPGLPDQVVTMQGLKIEHLTLKIKIQFEEILPSDVRLYVGTRNNPNLSILGAF